jgi:hypothetical protein
MKFKAEKIPFHFSSISVPPINTTFVKIAKLLISINSRISHKLGTVIIPGLQNWQVQLLQVVGTYCSKINLPMVFQ